MAIGTLTVNVVAETKKALQNMFKFRRAVKSTGRQVRRSARHLSNYGKSLALMATGGSLGYLIKQQFQLIDSLAKTSDKLGIATEQLAGLRHAAELTGVSAQTFDMALQRMTRRVAEAGMGTGESVKALKELGVSARHLAQLAPDEQFKAIAEAMRQVKTQGDRVRLAFKLFDSEGVAVVNTLKLGREGLNQAVAEVKRLGNAFSRVDAAKIEDANDAITRMRAAFQGLTGELAINLADPLQNLAKETGAYTKEIKLFVLKLRASYLELKSLYYAGGGWMPPTTAPGIARSLMGGGQRDYEKAVQTQAQAGYAWRAVQEAQISRARGDPAEIQRRYQALRLAQQQERLWRNEAFVMNRGRPQQGVQAGMLGGMNAAVSGAINVANRLASDPKFARSMELQQTAASFAAHQNRGRLFRGMHGLGMRLGGLAGGLVPGRGAGMAGGVGGGAIAEAGTQEAFRALRSGLKPEPIKKVEENTNKLVALGETANKALDTLVDSLQLEKLSIAR
jgi:hypothetical protein